jgi:tripartite-type tricarboxylate transporter receptor subunit TctC
MPLRLLFSLAALLLSSFMTAAAAQNYPGKPVRVIVAFGPGVVDTGARVIAQRLGEKWGQTVVVENRTGAGGNIAAEAAARAPGDGYTLLVTARNIVVNVALFDKVPYTPMKDLVPVSLFANLPFVIVTTPSLPVRNLQELIAYARANPGKLNFGSGGHGTTPHISGELFKLRARVEMTHIPYKGSAETVKELVAGRIQLAIDSVTPYLPFIERGDVRVIASAGARRIDKLPDVPTVAEAGLADFEAGAWLSIWAPGATPAAVVQQVNRDAAAVLDTREAREQMAKLGMEVPPAMAPAELDSYMNAEMRKWGEVVRVSGAKVN